MTCKIAAFAAIILFACGSGWKAIAAPAAGIAEWTLLIYMNGKNNLEPDAIQNFREIASVGSSKNVNAVVAFGRPKNHTTEEAESWHGVLRFHVKKGQQPVPSNAAKDLRSNVELSDMGSPKALDDFLDWAVEKYPAKKFMLIVWNHGQGWRFQMARDKSLRSVSSVGSPNAAIEAMTALTERPTDSPQVGGHRAVSFDDDSGRFLYNSDIQNSVARLSSRMKRKLDLIGFDACLMSMMETGYAFRDTAQTMVSSEELEPGSGWDYAAIMKALTAKPAMSAEELGAVVVEAYRKRFGDRHLTTLSVLDLNLMTAASTALSDLAGRMQASLPEERAAIEKARSGMQTYGAGAALRTSIDLISFLDRYVSTTSNAELRAAAVRSRDSASKTVLKNYASTRSTDATGSKGLAIYFPATLVDFNADFFKDGYVKSNTDHPVEFVQKERWADFLHSYLH